MATQQDELEVLKAQVAALTARIYMLEQRLGISAPAPSRPVVPPQPIAPSAPESGSGRIPEPPVPATTLPAPPSFSMFSSSSPAGVIQEETSLEKKIGQYWLNRVGIVAVLFGVAYFLKYAFDNGWIGDSGRVVIGLLCGIGLIVWSERFRLHGHAPFSYSLKAVGIGTLYLSLWYAFHAHVVPVEVAFAAMVAVTASTIVLALTQNAQLLAAFSLAGGFSTPVLLSTHQNHEVFLFCYVILLDLAVLVMAYVRPWRRLLWGSFIGTLILFCGWSLEFYTQDQRPLTTLFAAIFTAMFASMPLVTPFARSTRFHGPAITFLLLPLFNAAWFFIALYTMYWPDKLKLTIFALVLAAAYLAISAAFKRRFSDREAQVINLLHIAIAIAFITIAIPLKLNRHWITIGWLVESAVLLWIALRTKTTFLRFLAVAALVLGLFRLLVVDESQWEPQTLIFNIRFATYSVAIAIMAGIAYFGRRHGSEQEQPFAQLAAIALNVLALIALTGEAYYYFKHQQMQTYMAAGYTTDYRDFDLARDFSYSAIWLVYGAALMVVGFWKKTALVRWQALVLIAVTIAKVFVYDVRELDKAYRILSFIALGAVLLAISFVYQRDWLKLSLRPSGKSEETSS
jgi:uncharacterized membrane protein